MGLLFLVCFLCSASGLETVDLPQRPLSIPELVDIALKNNPSTKRVYWNAQRAADHVGIAESSYYPHLDAEASIEREKGYRPDTASSKREAELILSLLLYDCGKREASVAATKKLLQAAAWNVDWNVQQVLVQVFEGAYDMLYAQEVYEATCITVQEAEKMFLAAQELNRAGLKPISDVYTSQATLSSSKIDLSSKKLFVREKEAKLAVTLGLQANTSISVQPVEIGEAPKKELLDQLISYANAHRADFQEKQARYAAALFEVQKEKAAAWPKFSFFGQGGVSQTLHTSHDSVTGLPVHHDSKPRQYSAGIKVEVPLFTGFDLLYKKRAAMAEANVSQADVIELQLSISQDVAVATYSLEAAQEKLPDAQDSLDNATKAYQSTFERYLAGKGEIAELYNAQQQVASARIQYGTVKTQWLTSIANLAYATGTLS